MLISGCFAVLRWPHPSPPRIHLGARYVFLAKCTCHCVLGGGLPSTCLIWCVRNIYATQTATTSCPAFKDSEYRSLYLHWLDDANGLACFERFLANSDQYAFHHERSYHRLPVLYDRDRLGFRRAFLCTTLQEYRLSQMADAGCMFNDCCILYRYGGRDLRDKGHGCSFYRPCWPCKRMDQSRDDRYCWTCGSTQRYRCCSRLLWVNQANLRHRCW